MSGYRVYVLQSKAGRLYIGLSDNPERRLQQHNSDLSTWTKGKGPWHIIGLSENMSLSHARKLENKLKRHKGGVGLRRAIEIMWAPGS